MSARPPKHMASSSQAPFASSRPFGSAVQNKIPDRTTPQAFGAPHTNREGARQERAKQGQRGQQVQEADPLPLDRLTDDQKDEINEAVSGIFSRPSILPVLIYGLVCAI